MRAGFATIGEGVSDSAVAAEVAATLIRNDSLAFAVHPIVSAGYRAGNGAQQQQWSQDRARRDRIY